MARLREIKRRISSVDNTKQITRAMEMVATSKIKKAQYQIENLRPYTEKINEIFSTIGTNIQIQNELLAERETENVLLVPISANRGLCGAFNTNVFRKVENIMKNQTKQYKSISLFPIGKKTFNYFSYRKLPIVDSITDILDLPSYASAKILSDRLIDIYTSQTVDKIILIYNRFYSVISQKIIEKQLLPLQKKEIKEGDAEKSYEFLIEPSAEAIIPNLIKTYIETNVFEALVDSAASEHASRRKAMKSATDNADEMIFNLRRSFNRARQAQITQEIAEIVGGAEALTK